MSSDLTNNESNINSSSLSEDAFEIILALMAKDPQQAYYGIIITDDNYLVGQTVYPIWFDNSAQLQYFLIFSFPFLFASYENKDDFPDEIVHISNAVLDKEPQILTDAQIKLLNKHTNHATIRWTGTFDELCDGTSPTSREFISLFRNRTENARVISPDERSAFCGFLHDLFFER